MVDKFIVFFVFTVLVSACQTNNNGYGPTPREMAKAKAEREAKGIFNYIKLFPETSEIEFTYGNPTVQKMSFSDYEIFVNAQLKDHTISTYGSSHGTQIEYFSPSGTISLWYPGNANPVFGKYRTTQSMRPFNMWGDVAGVLICFTYQVNSYNPVTGTTGSTEECTSAYAFLAAIKGKRRGDVFNLSSGALPHSFKKGSPPKWPDGKNIIDKIAPHRVLQSTN